GSTLLWKDGRSGQGLQENREENSWGETRAPQLRLLRHQWPECHDWPWEMVSFLGISKHNVPQLLRFHFTVRVCGGQIAIRPICCRVTRLPWNRITMADEADNEVSDEPVIVAMGASAGGVRALQTFFGSIPPDTGAAYVVIVHLDPERRSELANILATRTKMPVVQVQDRQ